MKNQVFYRCPICGNLVGMIVDSGVTPVCCGKPMVKLEPGVSDGALEKHVPVLRAEDGRVQVTVGEIPHPMTQDHFIQWIYMQTNMGGHRRCLKPQDEPAACFMLCEGEQVIGVYAYCNLHGLWHKEWKE